MYGGTASKKPIMILGDFQTEQQGGRMTGVFGGEPE